MNPFDLGPHAAYILWSYAFTFLVIGGLVAWVSIDHRRQKATIADLERRGGHRRSARREDA